MKKFSIVGIYSIIHCIIDMACAMLIAGIITPVITGTNSLVIAIILILVMGALLYMQKTEADRQIAELENNASKLQETIDDLQRKIDSISNTINGSETTNNTEDETTANNVFYNEYKSLKELALLKISSDKLNIISNVYLSNSVDSVILYHLPENMKDYIMILTNEMKHAISKDLSF